RDFPLLGEVGLDLRGRALVLDEGVVDLARDLLRDVVLDERRVEGDRLALGTEHEGLGQGRPRRAQEQERRQQEHCARPTRGWPPRLWLGTGGQTIAFRPAGFNGRPPGEPATRGESS